MDIMQLMSMLQGGKINPNQLVNMLIGQNPQMKNAWEMANKMGQGKTPDQVQQVAQNLCKNKGIDFNQVNQMFNQFSNKK